MAEECLCEEFTCMQHGEPRVIYLTSSTWEGYQGLMHAMHRAPKGYVYTFAVEQERLWLYILSLKDIKTDPEIAILPAQFKNARYIIAISKVDDDPEDFVYHLVPDSDMRQLTRRLETLAMQCSIKFTDHLLVSRDGTYWYSSSHNKMLPTPEKDAT